MIGNGNDDSYDILAEGQQVGDIDTGGGDDRLAVFGRLSADTILLGTGNDEVVISSNTNVTNAAGGEDYTIDGGEDGDGQDIDTLVLFVEDGENVTDLNADPDKPLNFERIAKDGPGKLTLDELEAVGSGFGFTLGALDTEVRGGEMEVTEGDVLAGNSVVFSGATLRVNGRTEANGSSNGDIEVSGTLTGSGFIAGDVNILAGGIISPGNSIGTMEIDGDFVQFGTLEYEFRAPPSGLARGRTVVEGTAANLSEQDNDVIVVNGSATIGAGGAIRLAPFSTSAQFETARASSPSNELRFLVLRADSVSGTYAVVSNTVDVASNVAIETVGNGAGGEDLELVISGELTINDPDPDPDPDADPDADPDPDAEPDPDGDPEPDAETAEEETPAPIEFVILTGPPAGAAGVDTAIATVGLRNLERLHDLAFSAPPAGDGGGCDASLAGGASVSGGEPGSGWCMWMQAGAGGGSIEDDDRAHGSEWATFNGFFGFSRDVTEALSLGLAGGYSGTSINPQPSGESDVNSYYAAATAKWGQGPVSVETIGLVGLHDADFKTDTVLSGTSETNFDSRQYGASVEVGYRVPVGNSLAVEPVIGLSTSIMDRESYDSSGGGAEDFSARSETTTNLRSLMALDWQYRPVAETPVQLQGRLGWRHEFSDTHSKIEGSYRGAPDTTFRDRGPKVARDSLALQAGFRAAMTQSLDFRVNYDGEINADAQDHALLGRLSIRF